MPGCGCGGSLEVLRSWGYPIPYIYIYMSRPNVYNGFPDAAQVFCQTLPQHNKFQVTSPDVCSPSRPSNVPGGVCSRPLFNFCLFDSETTFPVERKRLAQELSTCRGGVNSSICIDFHKRSRDPERPSQNIEIWLWSRGGPNSSICIDFHNRNR